MTMIPPAVIAKWESQTAQREMSQIVTLLELRAYINEAKAEGERVVVQMYHEAAPAFRMTPKSLQNKILVLREYPDEKLRQWIADGYSFDTIDTVGRMSDMNMTKGESPAELLDRLKEQGNGQGKAPTAGEVENIILEQNGIKPAEYIFNRMGWKFASYYKVTDAPSFLAELLTLVKKYT